MKDSSIQDGVTPETRLLTSKQVANYLCICEKSVFDFVRDGKLKPIRLAAKAVRYDLADIDSFIAGLKG